MRWKTLWVVPIWSHCVTCRGLPRSRRFPKSCSMVQKHLTPFIPGVWVWPRLEHLLSPAGAERGGAETGVQSMQNCRRNFEGEWFMSSISFSSWLTRGCGGRQQGCNSEQTLTFQSCINWLPSSCEEESCQCTEAKTYRLALYPDPLGGHRIMNWMINMSTCLRRGEGS